jgi:predicted lactoylglutathione lyase
MNNPPRVALNVVTLGVTDFHRSVRFYEALGFVRKFRATGDEIAFFDAGAIVLGLFRWDMLAEDAHLPASPRPQAFRGVTLARMCRTDAEVDALMAHAQSIGAAIIRPAHHTPFGGYSGYFTDPDGHPWEAVRAPNFAIRDDGRVELPD